MEEKSKVEEKSEQSNPWAIRALAILALSTVAISLLYSLTTMGMDFTSGVANLAGGSTPKEVTEGAMLPYGVTFDNAGYEKLLEYYRTITLDSLTQDQRQRFIRVGTGERTGCGPCCGIQNGPGIDSNGNTRCGCGHNYALIGLMKHLVKNYGDKYTDQQIFEEIVRWKKLFFPGQIADDGSVIG